MAEREKLRNALRLRVFRAEITAEQRDASLNAWLADLAAGVLVANPPPWGEVMMEAERLSASHSEKLGTRSLDISYMAAAVVLELPEFHTFDRRRAALAKAAGLKVLGL